MPPESYPRVPLRLNPHRARRSAAADYLGFDQARLDSLARAALSAVSCALRPEYDEDPELEIQIQSAQDPPELLAREWAALDRLFGPTGRRQPRRRRQLLTGPGR